MAIIRAIDNILYKMKNKKGKIRGFFTALVLAFGALFAFSGCTASTAIAGIHMSSDEVVSVPYGNFSYDGIMVTVDYVNGGTKEIPLAEDMISDYEKLKFYKIGNQNVTVVLRGKYETIMKINVVLNKFNDVYALEDCEYVYDGLPHSVKLNHELPEGATINYPYGNLFSHAGTYEITGILSKRGYESKTLTAKLTILKAEKDASGIVFQDTTVVYNGEARTIEATNIPEGVVVSYEYYKADTKVGKPVNAGQYKVVAHFEDENSNYKNIPSKEAILTIEKANHDMSNVHLINVSKEYDGLHYEGALAQGSVLPDGVSVKFKFYDQNGDEVVDNIKHGTYKMEANFILADKANYNEIEPMTANLVVTKKVIRIKDKVTFASATFNFDEQVHSLAISGDLPENVKVTYINNEKKYAGEYVVTAKFTATNENEEVDVEEMNAYLIINRIRRSVLMRDEQGEYTKAFSSENIVVEKPNVSIIGYDIDTFKEPSVKFYIPGNPDGEAEDVKPENLVNGTTYEYIVVFEYKDENLASSIILSAESALYLYEGA